MLSLMAGVIQQLHQYIPSVTDFIRKAMYWKKPLEVELIQKLNWPIQLV